MGGYVGNGVACRAALAMLGLALAGCQTGKTLTAMRRDGDAAFASADYVTAEFNYASFVGQRPGQADIRWMLARTLIEEGRPRDAVEHAQVAFDVAPRKTEYLETLCEAMARSGKHEQLTSLLSGIATDQKSVDAYTRLGYYSERMGLADEAKAAYLTAARLDGGVSLEPQLTLARFFESIGDKSSAVNRYRMALYLDPRNLEATDALRRLGEIPGPGLAIRPEEQV